MHWIFNFHFFQVPCIKMKNIYIYILYRITPDWRSFYWCLAQFFEFTVHFHMLHFVNKAIIKASRQNFFFLFSWWCWCHHIFLSSWRRYYHDNNDINIVKKTKILFFYQPLHPYKSYCEDLKIPLPFVLHIFDYVYIAPRRLTKYYGKLW